VAPFDAAGLCIVSGLPTRIFSNLFPHIYIHLIIYIVPLYSGMHVGASVAPFDAAGLSISYVQQSISSHISIHLSICPSHHLSISVLVQWDARRRLCRTLRCGWLAHRFRLTRAPPTTTTNTTNITTSLTTTTTSYTPHHYFRIRIEVNPRSFRVITRTQTYSAIYIHVYLSI